MLGVEKAHHPGNVVKTVGTCQIVKLPVVQGFVFDEYASLLDTNGLDLGAYILADAAATGGPHPGEQIQGIAGFKRTFAQFAYGLTFPPLFYRGDKLWFEVKTWHHC